MTQDEVDLIYEYLHENYLYENGDLILIKPKQGNKIGSCLGRFIYWGRTRTQMTASVTVNKVKYSKPMAHFIYIFHKKKSPECIKYLDNNAVNNCIENLLSISRKEIEYNKSLLKKGYYKVSKKDGAIGFQIVFRSYSCPDYKIQGGVYYCEKKANEVYLKLKEIDFNHNGTQNSLKNKIKEFKNNSQPPKKGYYKENNKWIARIYINGKYKYLGCFKTPSEAHEAYLQAKKELSES